MTAVRHICSACGHVDDFCKIIERDGFAIDANSGAVSYRDIKLQLSKTQVQLLQAIALAGGTVLTAQDVIVFLRRDIFNDNVAAHISQIRARLTKAGAPDPIATVWGYGYKWSLSEALPR